MSGHSNRPLFVVTPQAEHGPLDYRAMRDLLASGAITLDDRVRTALGKEVGSVEEILDAAPPEAPSPYATTARSATRPPSVERAAAGRTTRGGERSAAAAPRRRPPLALLIGLGCVLLIAGVLLLRPSQPMSLETPQPATPPVARPQQPAGGQSPGGASSGSPTVRSAPAVPALPTLSPGLQAEYFTISAFEGAGMPELTGLTPVLRRVDQRIDAQSPGPWPGTALDTWFAVRWTGVLRVPADQPADRLVVLSLESDDGSRLTIDGNVLVDNGGNHPAVDGRGPARLSPGDHPITVEFFQGVNEWTCHLRWNRGDGDEVIDERYLMH